MYNFAKDEWTIESTERARERHAKYSDDKLLWTLPDVLYGVFRYIDLLHRRGGGGDPAWDLLHDRHLAGAAAGWLAATVYLLA